MSSPVPVPAFSKRGPSPACGGWAWRLPARRRAPKLLSARRRTSLLRSALLRSALLLSALLLSALLVGVAAPAAAQDSPPEEAAPVDRPPVAAPPPEPGAPPRIETGFTPDPLVLRGRTGGRQPLAELSGGCEGFVGSEPSQVLRLEGGFGFLRVFVVAPQPVTLALRGPDGEWHCGGEALGGAPREEASFGAGALEIWVGAATVGVNVPYAVNVTEFTTVGPGSAGERGGIDASGADIGLEGDATAGRHCARRIRRGFLPDPLSDWGTAGGAIDSRLLGTRCRGFVNAAPSHMLTLRDEFDYFRVQIGGASETTTLLVRTPDGRFLCSAQDDLNARVQRDAWPAGVYHIWVGSTMPDAQPAYGICYSEVRPHEGRIICTAERSESREAGCSRELHRCDMPGADEDPECNGG